MADSRKNRSWVVRAIISFVAILALLTFFSNTIMNATIPKVMAQNAVKGNLSFTNSATGIIEADNKTDVKSVNGREVDQILVRNYVTVEEGDVILTLKPAEDLSSLDALRSQLADAQATAEAAALAPDNSGDYSTEEAAIAVAQDNLNDANEALAAANGRDSAISTAQDTINYYNSIIPGLQATVDAEAATVADYNDQITAAQNEQNNTVIELGVLGAEPQPTPAPAPAETAAPAEGETGETSETTAAPADPNAARIAELQAQYAEQQANIDNLTSLRDAAQGRLDAASADLGAAESALSTAQGDLTAAQQLPSVADAQTAVNNAQRTLNQANDALSDARAQDASSAVTNARTAEKNQETIDQLEEQIAKLEESLTCTEIKAPCDGMVYGLSLSSGSVMQENVVIFTIIPNNATYSVKFTFKTSVASNFQQGMELTVNDAYVDQCRITNIYPDEADPREKRVVVCAVSSLNDIYPGTQLTVTADRSNASYDHVVPSSAVIHDNSGDYVYVVIESSSPLGDKYVVKRVDVTVEEEDGSLSAISPKDSNSKVLEQGMVVTRSEKPLHNGDRVRLEDYSNPGSGN